MTQALTVASRPAGSDPTDPIQLHLSPSCSCPQAGHVSGLSPHPPACPAAYCPSLGAESKLLSAKVVPLPPPHRARSSCYISHSNINARFYSTRLGGSLTTTSSGNSPRLPLSCPCLTPSRVCSPPPRGPRCECSVLSLASGTVVSTPRCVLLRGMYFVFYPPRPRI